MDDNKKTLTPEDVARVKGLGFLRRKGTDEFNGRVITRNGKLTNEEFEAVGRAAKLYGNGEIAMTSRLTLEVQGVPYDNIEPFRAELAKAGLMTGGTGKKVRPVVSCKGTTCQFGLIDTFALSQKIHDRFFIGMNGLTLPHKFKIAVGGCPNNCVKPDLNDVGVVGQRIPVLDEEKCRGCKKCLAAAGCPIGASSVVDGKYFRGDDCNGCGRCIAKCPFGSLGYEGEGYRIYIGGRWGKKCARGIPLSPVFTDEEAVLGVIEKAIMFFKEKGIDGERFADTINRIGFEEVEKELLS